MNARSGLTASTRSRRSKRSRFSWASLRGGERVGKKKAWKCIYCGVIGSHRRGCHYVTKDHHRGPKPVRRGVLGARARGARRKARIDAT